MNKNVLKIALVSAAAAAVIAGISIGVTKKLYAGAEVAYKERIASGKDFEINGEKLYYLNSDSPEYQEETYYSKAVYKDEGGLYYTFNADTQELCKIENTAIFDSDYTGVAAEELKPYSDTQKLLANAKSLVDKWCDKDTKSELKFECTQSQWDTTVGIYQVINDEISFELGGVVYDENGVFASAYFGFDSMLSSKDIANMLSKEEAVKTVTEYLEKTYNESDWSEIEARALNGGKLGNCWSVQVLKYRESGIPLGYLVAIDILTGEVKAVDKIG